MKHLIKKFALLSYFCLAIFLYYSCTQEKEYINGQNRINFDLKEKSLKEALDMTIFSNAYSKLTKKKFSSRTSETARTALEDQFGFTIVPDEPIRIITRDDGTVLFTILIERELKEELIFENLMIKVKNDETTAGIIKYLMTEKAVKIEFHDAYATNIASTEFTDLHVDGKMFFSGNSETGEICVTTTTVMCSALSSNSGEGINHVAGIGCLVHAAQNGIGSLYTSSSTLCSGGGGVGGATTSSSSSNGGGGAPYDVLETFTLPCHTDNCIESDKTPCEALNDLFKTNKGNISSTLTLVNNMSIGINAERGAYFTKVGSTYGNQTIAVGAGGDAFAYSVNLPTGLTIPGIYAAVHSHPFDFNAAPMFSFEDLKYLFDLYRFASPENKEDVVFMLLLPNGSTYAIKIDNYASFVAYIQSYGLIKSVLTASDPRKEKNRVFDKRTKNGSKQGDTDMEEKYVRGFLDEMKNHGVSLYKKTLTTHPLNSSLVEGWEKLEPPINPSGTEIVKSSCN